jgi:hypothetical protein
MNFYKSWRDAPGIPNGWNPKHPPKLTKVKIKNKGLLAALRATKPGRWFQVYHEAEDGSAIHYCQHESGDVFDVEHHPAGRRR